MPPNVVFAAHLSVAIAHAALLVLRGASWNSEEFVALSLYAALRCRLDPAEDSAERQTTERHPAEKHTADRIQ